MQAESGLGLAAQKVACIEYARKQGQEISEFFEDSGYSGSLSVEKRPALLRVLCTIEKGDILLVAKRDRLSRDSWMMATLEKDLEKKKAKIISVAGEGTLVNDPSSFLVRKMTDIISEYEKMMIQQRVKVAMAVKKSRGERVGYIPYGYKLAENGIHLEPNDEEMRVIIVIMYLRNYGYTFRKIASELAMSGNLNRNNVPWNHVSVFNLVSKWHQTDVALNLH